MPLCQELPMNKALSAARQWKPHNVCPIRSVEVHKETISHDSRRHCRRPGWSDRRMYFPRRIKDGRSPARWIRQNDTDATLAVVWEDRNVWDQQPKRWTLPGKKKCKVLFFRSLEGNLTCNSSDFEWSWDRFHVKLRFVKKHALSLGRGSGCRIYV